VFTLHLFRVDPDSRLMYYMDKGYDRLVIPHKLRHRILKYIHDSRTHTGSTRTYNYLRSIAYFPKMREFVDEFCFACPVCQLTEPVRRKPFGNLQPIVAPTIPISVIGLDFVVGLPTSKQGKIAAF
jgi:hypothetical protein